MPSGTTAGVLSDVQLLATSFSDGPESEELGLVMRDIRPVIETQPRIKRAASNETLALAILLMLLADRAARSYDGEAIEMADEIASRQARILTMLACDGANALANTDRLRDQARKATAVRMEEAAAGRKLIREQLEQMRSAGEPRRGAPKRAACALRDHPSFNRLDLDNLVDRCRKVASADFPEWE
jgi:hypothetical protein